MTVLKAAAATLIAGGVLIQLVRPARTNPPTDRLRALRSGKDAPAATAGVLQRACRDCHSNDTRWPWYSNVAPVSWFVIDHVNHGRRHFNYSEWAKYEPAEAAKLMRNSCELSRKGEMPLPSYMLMHGDTRLSSDDVNALCSWISPARTSRPANTDLQKPAM